MTTKVWAVIRGLVVQVIVEPVRTGRLRSDGWPPGLRPVIAVGIGIYALGGVVSLGGRWLRQWLPPGDSAFGISPSLFEVTLLLAVVLASLVITASLHGPWALRVVGLLVPTVLWLTLASMADQVTDLLWPAGSLAVLIIFAGWRWRRDVAWWEFAVVLGIVGLGTLCTRWMIISPAIERGYFDYGIQVVLVIMSVAVFAIPFTITAGAAVSEVALGTATWLVELVSRQISVRALHTLVIIGVVVAWLVLAWRWSTSILPGLAHAMMVVISAVAVLFSLAGWLAVDSLIDRRDRLRGQAPGETRVHQLPEQFRPLGFWLAIVLAGPFMLNWIWSRGESGLRPILTALGLSYRPGNLQTRLGLDDVLGDVFGSGFVVATVLSGVIAAVAIRRRTRGTAELAVVITVLCAVRAAGELGLPYTEITLDDLALVAVAVTTIVYLHGLLSRRLTPTRIEAIAGSLLLSIAVTGRDVFADPLAWILGSSGGALVVIGLVWSFLTGAEDANGDSPRFPRPSRALAIVAYLALAMLIAAFDGVAVTFAIDLERFVLIGADVFGTALIITGLWALLSVGRSEEVVEPSDQAGIVASTPLG